MSTASPRDIIASLLAPFLPHYGVSLADIILRDLSAAGYRVVREGELDAVTEFMGFRIVADPAIPVNVIEARDRDGNLLARIDLAASALAGEAK